MVVFFMTERGVGVVLAAAVSSRCFPAIVIQGKQVVGVFSPDACLIVKEGIIDLGRCKPGQRFFIQHVLSFCKKSYRVSHDFDRAGLFLCIIEFMRFYRHSVHSLKKSGCVF